MTDKLVNEIEKIPLSGDDLIRMASCLGSPRVKYILYDDLEKVNNVDELFGDAHAVYILLQIKNQENIGSIGHWVCFIHHIEKDEYYWYDPYGLRIAQELSITKEPSYIINITKGVKVDENINKHQKFSSDINTCGRHCVLRSVFHHLNNTEYNKLVISPMTPFPIKYPDDLVALITGLSSKSDEPLIKFFNKKEAK